MDWAAAATRTGSERRASPILVKLNDVQMFQLNQIIKHCTDLFLLQFVVLAFRELYLIPHNLYTFLCVHGQVCTVNTWYITLIHLFSPLLPTSTG